jgi:hypothetical protein
MNSRLLLDIPDGAIRGIKEYNHYIGRGLVADACFHLQTWLHRPHEGRVSRLTSNRSIVKHGNQTLRSSILHS